MFQFGYSEIRVKIGHMLDLNSIFSMWPYFIQTLFVYGIMKVEHRGT